MKAWVLTLLGGFRGGEAVRGLSFERLVDCCLPTVEKEDHGVMKMLAAVALRFFLLTKLYKRSNPFCETIRNAYQLSP